ncbi:MAG: MarR family transcriptional regulator [Anaerolineaceae bacterium]|nr:MarR family transcriptional regulator [Anaerolineaceae bacterium]
MSADTPQRILDYLGDHPRATAQEISLALHMTKANVGYHLKALLQQGQVEARPAAQASRRGRPQLIYRLSTRTDVDALQTLACALLRLAFPIDDPARHHAQLLALARQMLPPLALQTGLPGRLNRAVVVMQQLRYRLHWEARQDGPHLIVEFSPFDGALPGQDVLDGLDAALLETLLGRPLKSVSPASRREYILLDQIPPCD